MKLCWLIPDDRGGGVAPVAASCVRQACISGHDAVLLFLRRRTGSVEGEKGVPFYSLEVTPEEDRHAPQRILNWLKEFPQDFLFFNACGQADAIPFFIPNSTRNVYVVHDTANIHWRAAVKAEGALDAIVAVSNVVANKFRHILLDAGKVRVIYNGTRFPPIGDLGKNRSSDLLFMGGDNPMKGAHDLLRLWLRLLSSGFAGRVHWFGSITDAFDERIRRLPSAERILRHGHTARSQIFEAAAVSKAILILSRAESFGMAAIEAMSMGCVPVAWDIATGTKEVLAKTGGFVAPLGDFVALADRVLQALTAQPEMSGLLSHTVRENFSEERMWNGYAELIEEVRNLSSLPRRAAGAIPLEFRPPRRRFQLLPRRLRWLVRDFIGHHPRLGYWLRDLRGW